MDFLVLVIDVYIGDIARSFHFYQEPGGKKKLFNLFYTLRPFYGTIVQSRSERGI